MSEADAVADETDGTVKGKQGHCDEHEYHDRLCADVESLLNEQQGEIANDGKDQRDCQCHDHESRGDDNVKLAKDDGSGTEGVESIGEEKVADQVSEGVRQLSRLGERVKDLGPGDA